MQINIVKANENSLMLKGQPRLLPVSKIKPNKNVQNTKINQICGSAERKEVSHFT